MFNLIASVDGVETINRAFNRTEGFVADMRNFAPGISTEFYKAETEQFKTEGAAGASGKWAPLSPAYKRWKENHYPGEPILRLRHPLVESLTSPDGLDSIFRVSRDEIVFGSKTPYARAHQRGAGNMPARPPISLSESQKRRIQKSVQRDLIAFTRQAGFQVEEKAA